MGHNDAQRIIDVIRQATAQGMKSGAQIEYSYGEISSSSGYEVSAYLNGNYEAASEGFRVPAIWHVNVSDYALFAIDHGTGGKWLVEVLPNSLFAQLSVDVNNGLLYLGDGTDEGTPIVPGTGGGGGGIPSSLVWSGSDPDVLATELGDLLVAEGADTIAPLNVGTDGQVLTADSAETLGIKWATPVTSGAPTGADYLVGTAQGGLSAEIVVGTSPGGELGGTWASPTIDSAHSGSTHAATQAAAEATAASADATHAAAADPHTGYQKESGKNATSSADAYAGLDNDASARVPAARLATGTPDGTKFLRDDRTWVTPSSSGYAPALYRVTADRSISSTTLADITDLNGISTAAGATYYFKAVLLKWSNATGVGFLGTLNHSTAITSLSYTHTYYTGAGATVNLERVTALQGGTVGLSSYGTALDYDILEGYVVINTAGTLAVQHKSETATETRTLAGSFLLLQRIS